MNSNQNMFVAIKSDVNRVVIVCVCVCVRHLFSTLLSPLVAAKQKCWGLAMGSTKSYSVTEVTEFENAMCILWFSVWCVFVLFRVSCVSCILQSHSAPRCSGRRGRIHLIEQAISAKMFWLKNIGFNQRSSYNCIL